MADLDTIAEIVISARTEGVREAMSAVDGLTKSADRLSAANDDLAQAEAAVATGTERSTRYKISATAAAERLQRQLDAEYRQQKQLEAALRDLERARQQGVITAAREAELARLAEQRYAGTASAARDAAQAVTALGRAQAQWAALSGQGAAQGSQFKESERVAAQFRAFSAQGAQQLALLNGMADGANRAAAANDNLGQRTEVARHHLVNLGYQLSDVAASLGSGASPFTIMLQQGGQIAPILGETGITGALRGIGGMLANLAARAGVFGALAIGATAAGGALLRYIEQQRQAEISLLGVGRASGATAAQIERLAEEQASAAGISVATAKEVAEAFASTGKIQVAAFAPGIAAIKDYAAATRQDIPAAAADLARSLSNLAGGGLQEIQDKTFAFDGKVTDLVRSLLEQGRTLEAQQTILRALSSGLDEAGRRAEKYGGAFGTAVRLISDAATKAGQMVRDISFPDEAGVLRNLQTQQRNRRALGLDTADVDRQIADVQRGLAEVDRKAAETAAKARQNVEASSQAAAKAVIPEIESLEKINALREQANKTRNAREAQGDTSSQEYVNAGKALEATTKALRDYEAAGGAAAMAVYKRKEVEQAEAAVLAAKAPADRANAARDLERAQQIGAVIERQDRYNRLNEAAGKVLREAAQASQDQSRAQNEATKTANDLADANTATGRSVQYLTAARKVDEQIAAGTIDRADRELKIREQLQNQLAGLNQQQAERIRQARTNAGAQEDLNAKVAAGTLVSAEAQRRLSAEIELRNLARERDAASGEAKTELAKRYDELKAAQEAQMSAEDRSRVQGLSEDEDRRIAALQREAELLGLTTRQRQVELAVLQAKQDLERQGISTTSPESVAYLDKVRLRSDMDAAKSQYERLAQDISSVVSGIFDDMFRAGNKGLSGLADSFSRGFARIGTRLIEQNLIAPLLSDPGKAAGNLFSGFQSLFNSGDMEKAVRAGAESGVGLGIADAAKPQGGGGFATSKLGMGLTAAGAGAAIGYQSQSPLMGALGGAMAGLATGNPILAAVGAGAGLIGGLLGQSKAREERQKQIQEKLKELKDQYEGQRTQIEQFRAGLRGEATGGVEGELRAAFAQMIQANKIASQGGDQAAADQMVVEFKAYEERMRAGVRATMDGVEAEVLAGFGTNGPFAQAAASVRQLGETMRSWLNDVNAATGAFDSGALDAIYKGLLATLQPTPEMSSTAKEYQRIQGTAAALQQELVRLNGSAEGAAAAIREGVTKALDTLRDSFNADLDARINDAQGKGYLNDVVDLLKEVSGLRLDANLIGGDLGKVDTYFAAAGQKIVNESQLTGEAFSALVTQYPALNGLVREYSAALADQASTLEQVAERVRGFQDRLFAATNDSTTLAGQLAAFDRAAAKERADEAKAGGQAMADLEQALAAERLNVIKTFAEQAAQAEKAIADRRLGFADRLFAAQNDTTTLAGQLAAFDRKAEQERQAEIAAGGQAIADLEAAQYAERLKLVTDYQTQAADAERQRMEAAQQAFDTFARNIKTFVDGLRAGTASPLSPQARLAAAQSQYNAQLTLAQGGDRTALDGITSYASDLLDAAKGFYASSAAFQTIFQQVTGQLTALPSQVSPEQFIVNAIDASKTATVAATQAMQAALKTAIDAGSASATASALLPQFNTLTATTGGLLNYSQFVQATGGLATAAEQQQARAIFNAIDQNGDGQISRLEAVQAQAYQVSVNTIGTNNRVDRSNTIMDAANAIMNTQKGVLDGINAQAFSTASQVITSNGILSTTQGIASQQKAVLDGVNIQTFNSASALNTANGTLAQLQALNGQISGYTNNTWVQLNGSYDVQLKSLQNLQAANAKNGAAVYSATGGWIRGPGTATSDSIPAFLSNGEFVVNAASARVYGPLLEAMNDNRMAGFAMPTVPVPLPMPVAMGANDNSAILAALQRQNELLQQQVALLQQQIRATVAGAEHVAEHVDRTTDAVEDGQRTAAALAA